MRFDLQEKLAKKQMTRREFLQFAVSSVLVLFGVGNIIALLTHVKKTADSDTDIPLRQASHGFGSRKFGA